LPNAIQKGGANLSTQIIRVKESSSAGKDTHTHTGYQKMFRYVREQLEDDPSHEVLDLFARKCPWGDFRNDLNPEFKKSGHTNMCMDALDAVNQFGHSSIDVVLFDPPFSSRMDADKYDEVGRASLWTDPKYITELGKAMHNVLVPGGYIVKAGYNSNPPYPTMELVKMCISHYGACRNDVIFTVWKKIDTSLFQYYSVD
jgi:hypothetical protein